MKTTLSASHAAEIVWFLPHKDGERRSLPLCETFKKREYIRRRQRSEDDWRQEEDIHEPKSTERVIAEEKGEEKEEEGRITRGKKPVRQPSQE